MSKPLAWFRNASRRTVIAWLPALARPDDEFARRWLPPEEYRLYLRMDPRDRQHAVEVASRVLELRPDAPAPLVRAALLHDVGKSLRPYNPLFRMLAHLYSPAGLPEEPLLPGLQGAWQLKRHHQRYGERMVREAGGSREVAELVARHHEPQGDPAAALLKSADDAT